MASMKPIEGKVDANRRQAYEVRWRVWLADGSRRQKSKTVYGRREAEKFRDRMQRDHETDATPEPGQETLLEVAEWWLDRYKNTERVRGKTVEEESYKSALRDVNYLIKRFDPNVRFSAITAKDLDKAVKERPNMRTHGPAATGTRERALGTFKAMWSDAHNAGIIHDNVARDLKAPSRGPKRGDEAPHVVIYSTADMQRFADALDIPHVDVPNRWGSTHRRPRWSGIHDEDLWVPSDRFWFFALTGFSFSEARGVRPDDIKGRIIRLRQVWTRRAEAPRAWGKTDARMTNRVVPVPIKLVPILERLTDYTRCDVLLTGPDGKPLKYETWRHQMQRTCEMTGLKITTHGLRHYATSMWVDVARRNGRDWRPTVVRYGGWSDTTMVEKVYGHIFDQTVEEEAVDIDDALEAGL